MSQYLVDKISIPTQRKLTDSGMMIVPCTFARTGVQEYSAGQLGLEDRDSMEIVQVHREESEVFDEASMESFRSAPITIGHPRNESGESVLVSSENSKELQVGMLEGMPHREEDMLAGTIVLSNQAAIDALEDASELSAGYTCDIVEKDGKFYQQNIKANHIAIVAKGRAGASCRIADEEEAKEGAEEEVKEIPKEEAKVEDKQEDLSSPVAKLKKLVADAKEAKAAMQEKQLAARGNIAHVGGTVIQVAAFQDSLENIESRISVQDELLKKCEALVDEYEQHLADKVAERCHVIDQARQVSPFLKLEGLTEAEIKRAVVMDQVPNIDMSDKDDIYIKARFDILVDEAQHTSPIAEAMVNQMHVVADSKVMSPAEEARQRMMERFK